MAARRSLRIGRFSSSLMLLWITLTFTQGSFQATASAVKSSPQVAGSWKRCQKAWGWSSPLWILMPVSTAFNVQAMPFQKRLSKHWRRSATEHCSELWGRLEMLVTRWLFHCQSSTVLIAYSSQLQLPHESDPWLFFPHCQITETPRPLRQCSSSQDRPQRCSPNRPCHCSGKHWRSLREGRNNSWRPGTRQSGRGN